MNPENYTDPLLRDINYSTHPNAVAMRKRRAADPKFRLAGNTYSTKRYRSNKANDLRKGARMRAHLNPGKLERIRFHVSRGRDAGSIAVREGWLVSDVEKLIAQLA